MSINVAGWRRLIRQTVAVIANEQFQRATWFGHSSYFSNPDEIFNQFFGDVATKEFLERDDTGLNDLQMEAGKKLLRKMEILADSTPNSIDPKMLIDDPRWRDIRQSAAHFSSLLEATFGKDEPLDQSGDDGGDAAS